MDKRSQKQLLNAVGIAGGLYAIWGLLKSQRESAESQARLAAAAAALPTSDELNGGYYRSRY